MNYKVSAEKVATPFRLGINEQKRMHDTVSESEQKFRCLVENAAVSICIIDLSGRFTYVNNAMADLLGYSAHELLGRSFGDFLHSGDKGRIMRLFIRIIGLRRPPRNLEFRVKRKDGSVLHLMSKPTRFEVNGKTVGFQAIIVDVTKRKQMEEALSASESKFKNIFENATDCIIHFDCYGRILDVNKKAVEIFGGKKQELLGKHFTKLNVYPPREVPRILCSFAKILADRKAYLITHIRNMRCEEIDLECSGSLIKANDKLTVLVVARDITERKKAEDALKKSENKSRLLLENLPQKIFFKDKNSVYISCNENYARDLKIKADKITGKTDYDFYPKQLAEKYRADDKRIIESGKTEDIDEEYMQNGRKVFVHTVKTPIKDENDNVVGILGIFWDITEKKNAEEQGKRLLEFQKKVIDTAIVWIDLLDAEGNVTLWNRAAELISGYSREEVVGHKKIWEWLYPNAKYRKEVFGKARTIIERGEHVENYQTAIRCKGGTLKTISWYSNNILDEKGKPAGSIAIGTDITEINKAQEKIAESEGKYRNLFQNARDVILTLDLKGNVTSANKAVEKYGYKETEIIGKNMLEFVPKKYWTRLLKELMTAVRRNSVKGEIEIIVPKGKLIAEYSSNPITQGNNVIGLQTILRDVTERKELEEKLRQYSEHLEQLIRKRTEELLEAEKKYSVLVEEASDGVVILQDRKIAFANMKAEEMFGYSRDELIGMPFEKPVDEKYHQLVIERYTQRLRGEKVPATYEVEVVTKTGEHKPIELSATHINYQGRPADLVIIRDISERKRLEEQRIRLERLATMGELAAMVAHDLRNPLTSIRNASYYIKKTCSCNVDANKTRLEMIDIIEQETLFADNIINDLLDFSTKRPLQKNRQDINEITKASIAKSNVPKNINIEMHFAKQATAKIDERQLERVFLNLIKNAVQAMPNGGKLTLTTKETNDFVEIVFTDTGLGILEENMTKLFAPLFTTKAKGIGMGLAICKKIVEEHDGTIDFESKVGQGTTFTIKLPKKEGANAQ
jgi:PAS domain S-box-containing protein